MLATLRERWLDWLVVIVLLGLFGFAVRGSTAAYAGDFFPTDWQPWWDGFLQNSGTEMLGAFLTFILLEVIRGSRERQAQEEAEERRTKATQELVRGFVQAQETARLRAAKTPEERQPILNSMRATELLQGAALFWANLQGADLSMAKLQGAWLHGANLQGADLFGANLQGADLQGVNLEEAVLFGANLEGAILKEANLQGAYLREANLRGAYLEGATFSEKTILPDDTRWTPDTNMARFTDPEHPDFWRSDNPLSPAYGGDDDDDNGNGGYDQDEDDD